jgi:predicted RNase H-like nuclease (RuvC/YqgF family)
MSADDEARLERLRGLARGGVGIPRQTDAQFIVAQLDAAQERVRELEQHKCWTLSQRVNDVEAERDALAHRLAEAQARVMELEQYIDTEAREERRRRKAFNASLSDDPND